MNVRLLVLGLLRAQPMHGYELHRWLEVSRADLWADVLPGSVYHALRQMHKEGLVEMQSTERTGNRSRAVYAITPAGEAAFARLLAEGWRAPPRSFPAALYTLLTFSDHLPTPVLRAAVQQQIAAVEQELSVWEEGAALKTQAGVLPAWGLAMFENGRRHLEADLQLLRSLLTQLGAQDPSP
jgi:DNA-binding PadR family transcriptional regulator